VWAKRRGL